MENENRETKKDELVFGDEEKGGGGAAGKIIAVLLVVLVILGGAGVYLYKFTDMFNAEPDTADLTKGVYTADGIGNELLKALESKDEFSALKFMDMENVESGKKGEKGKKDALDVYNDILKYKPRNLTVRARDNLQKYYYLNVHRAEAAMRRKNYKAAFKFYKKANKIKPGVPSVLEGMDLAKKKAVLKAKKGPFPNRRTYDSVYDYVQGKMSMIKYLYNKERRISPDLKGKVNVEFTIRSNGTVKNPKVVERTMTFSEKFEAKLIGFIRTWDFGKVEPEVGPMKMSYPFVFN